MTFKDLAIRLKAVFPEIPIEREWMTMRGELARYSPRLDIAVGPFATGTLRYGEKFDEIFASHQKFIQLLYDVHLENLKQFAEAVEIDQLENIARRNYNARCFLAIEIEHQSSARSSTHMGLRVPRWQYA